MRRERVGRAAGFAGIAGADWLLYGAGAAVALGIGVVNALSRAQDVACMAAAMTPARPCSGK